MEDTGRNPGEPLWEVCYAVVYVITAAIVEAGPVAPPGRIASGAALAALAVWYLVVIRPLTPPIKRALRPLGPAATVRGTAALLVLVALAVVVLAANPAGWLLAFALCPMFLRTLHGLPGMALVVLLNLAACVLAARAEPALTAAAVGATVFAMGLALVFGRWMHGVMMQSEERAELITELSQTR
jgi:hypothetical protein